MTDPDQRLRRFNPVVTPPTLPDGDISYAVHDTPVGPLVVAVDRAGTAVACSYAQEELVTRRLAHTLSPLVLRAPQRLDTVRRQLDEYFLGRRAVFELPVATTLATPFTRRVLQALLDVPYGTTTSYAALAARIGSPSARRAVVNALGANPVCLLLPCHRVVRTDGTPGGYAGGSRAKAALLDLEREVLGKGTSR